MERSIKYETEQDTRLLDLLADLPEGSRLRHCLQCGTCSAACPVAPALEHTPRRIFALLRAGLRDDVLTSMTPWACASCYKCTVECPAQIKITEIMYALKRLAIARGVGPADDSAQRFCKLFTGIICKNGRNYELGLMMRQMMFSQPFELLRQSPLGLKMMLAGELPLLPHKIRAHAGLRKIVERAVALEYGELS